MKFSFLFFSSLFFNDFVTLFFPSFSSGLELIASDLHRRLDLAPQQLTYMLWKREAKPKRTNKKNELLFLLLLFCGVFQFDLDIHTYFDVGAKPLTFS